MGTRGVFSLNRVIQKRYINDWVNLSNVWIDQGTPNTGYYGGGFDGTIEVSLFDKLNYSSETTTVVPGTGLSISRTRLAATGSISAGYFGGGASFSLTPLTYYSTVDKITYSTDTTSALPVSGFLSLARSNLAATGSSSAGYFGGGVSPAGAHSTVNKVTYSSDTSSTLPVGGFLSVSRFGLAATGSSSAGYFGGGNGFRSTMDKLTYSTDTTSALPVSGFLSIARANLMATGSSSAGYFGGGLTPSSSTTVDKLTYSTDTTLVVPGLTLFSSRYNGAATGSSGAGYFGAGQSSGILSSIDKINYSTETSSGLTGVTVSVARVNLGASSAKANALPSVWRRFSDGSTTTNPASLPPATPTPQTFNLPTPDTGYFGGGGFPSLYSTVDKLTYTTETTAAVPGAPLGVARYYLAATGNSTAGYFGGGFTGPSGEAIADVSRVNYLTDTSSATNSALIPVRHSLAAVGSQIFGYFGGGQTFPSPSPSVIFYSLLDKVIYSIDSDITIPATLSIGRSGLTATGNSIAGYFGGGEGVPAISPTKYSTIDKLIYSTETVTTISSPLSASINQLAATGNSTAGYFGGGTLPSFFTPALTSSVDKLTYSTDTTAAAPTATLTSRRNFISATGNSTAGYFSWGTSSMDKITYSTDTKSVASGTALSSDRYALAASSARANALPQPTYPAPVFV